MVATLEEPRDDVRSILRAVEVYGVVGWKEKFQERHEIDDATAATAARNLGNAVHNVWGKGTIISIRVTEVGSTTWDISVQVMVKYREYRQRKHRLEYLRLSAFQDWGGRWIVSRIGL